ncbi:PepSY-associated TM helix domain-containing protein [Paracidovorax avenae]|uniref:PepSY-associated TM helix domain-containing protein n=1 Tax=Paracidovorax avenae TaxID=80867 RepID=UPI0006B33BF1|nr:PepSY-associated TM helix domain-containing protein [Paracidovorax avenae]
MNAAPATTASWRKRMVGVHTWCGIVLGVLLLVVFWTGTLSVFDRELDRWMMPATRLPAPHRPPPLDALQPVVQALVPASARQWRIDWATPRTPVLRLSWQGPDGVRGQRYLDAATLAVLPAPETWGASGFIFPFHYGLHWDWKDLGKWLVGLAGMGMLVLLVGGVVIHRRLLADFFTFRPRSRLPRSSLDLHNVTGVMGLPFHVAITMSGLVIFWSLYFPQAHVGVYGDGPQARAALQADGYGRYQRPRAGPATAPMASLDAMADAARRTWGAGAEPYFLRVWNPGDRHATVELRRSYAREVSMNLDQLFFDAATGRPLHRFEAAPAMGVQRFISGLHFIQFEHPLLRWLYFGLGLSGCVLIASGLVHWLAARRARTPPGLRWRLVESLCIAGTTGTVVATLAFLAANRLLPDAAHALGWTRAELEAAAFYGTWLACLALAVVRGTQAWRDQATAISGLALVCVVLNALTTGAYGAAWSRTPAAVVGVDIMLLLLATVAAWSAQRIARGSAAA